MKEIANTSCYQTPVRNSENGGEERKRISYCLSSNKRGDINKIISERVLTEKADLVRRLGGPLKAASIESQIVCLEREQLVDLVLSACADYPEFLKKVNKKYLNSLSSVKTKQRSD
ncbi:hypothetical protein FG386_000754 [Cryptosporidium ryanae]|uniref:uncharacterized protein n=1 Tax=Cryptosporidium ryanae TaxID=515981 RepID=UPI00351A6411|nr:hypothetical protein FG386_000754 [Cryptosporidium ryanae]